MKLIPKYSLVVAMVMLISVFVGACGGDDADRKESKATGEKSATSKGATKSGSDDANSSDAGTSEALKVATSDHGEVLVDGSGKAVYAYSNDTPMTSTCVDACADAWPPVPAPEDGNLSGGEGVEESRMATMSRPDGTQQLSINGAPLYYYSGDAEGEFKGHGQNGENGNWSLVTPLGSAVGD